MIYKVFYMKSSIASTQQLLKFGLARLIRMMSTKLLEDLPIEWRRSSRHSPSSQWVKHPNRSKQATRSTTRYNYTNTFIRRKLYGQWADHLCIFKQQAQLLTATYCDKPHVCPTRYCSTFPCSNSLHRSVRVMTQQT